MSINTLGRVRNSVKPPRRRLSLNCDRDGGWTLSGLNSSDRKFADFTAALENARHAPGNETATVEIWQGGEYICCLSPPVEPAAHLGRPARTAANSNRAAQWLRPAVGMVFWLSLMVIALGASRGWRLALL